MLIKVADDKSKRLKLLEELQRFDQLDFTQKDWLRQQWRRLSPDLAGERDAAYYLDRLFAKSKNHAVLHDLRLEAEGQIAQIDHLVLDPFLTFFLIETKTYKGSLHINAHGEFSVEYPGDRICEIESPLEQSRRHETVLKKVLDRLGMTEFVGIRPYFVHVVMIHPKGMIYRADPKAFDSSMVIKANQFSTWYKALSDKLASGIVDDLLETPRPDTVKEWAEQLKSAHCPEDQLELPDFMAPLALAEIPKVNGLPVCATCGKKLSPKVAKFCADMVRRFGGHLYCYNHQTDFPDAKK